VSCGEHIPDRRLVTRLSLLAIGFGLVCAWAVYRHAMPVAQDDFSIIWYGAHALVSGGNPYAAVGPGRAFPWGYPLLYPLPGILVGVPLVPFGPRIAAAIFAGLGAALLWFGVVRSGKPYLLLVLASAPFIYAVGISQWSPLLVGAALVPAFGFLLVAKPTIGAALFLYRPSWRAAIGAVFFIVLAFVIDPGWLGAWREALRGSGAHMPSPIAHGAGPLLALAVLRWRRPEARLLLVMACIPQTPILYETLPLALIPASLTEMVIFVALSWAAYAWWYVAGISVHVGGMHLPLAAQIPISLRIIVPLLYLPCLVMVLHRSNEGALPAWMEMRLARWRGRFGQHRATRSTTA